MNKEFEKILESLEELQNNLLSQTEGDVNLQVGVINGVMYSKKIVQEVAEEYNGGWIPCSDRLPEDDDTLYLVSYTKIFFDKPFYFMDIAYLYTCKNGTRYWVSAKSDSIRKVSKVSAWQPLPEQYKEG